MPHPYFLQKLSIWKLVYTPTSTSNSLLVRSSKHWRDQTVLVWFGNSTESCTLPTSRYLSQTRWTCCKRWSLEWAAPTGTQPWSLQLQRLLWIYCPGHAWVGWKEQADRLASTADITSPGLQLGRAEVLRGLRNFLNMDRPEHHSIDRLKERGVGKGSGRHSILQSWEWSVFNQTNIGTVSRATLGRLLGDGVERVWAFWSAIMPSWAETENWTGPSFVHQQLSMTDLHTNGCENPVQLMFLHWISWQNFLIDCEDFFFHAVETCWIVYVFQGNDLRWLWHKLYASVLFWKLWKWTW